MKKERKASLRKIIATINLSQKENILKNHESGSEAYLEFSGKFGKTIFKDIYKPIKGVHWEARSI